MNHSANPGKTIRRSNRAAILNLLYRRGSQLRSDIANRLGLTGAAVSRITRELINAGIVEQALPEKKTGVLGRRSAILRICEQGAYVLALTLTANRKSAAIFDASGGMVGLTELARDIDSSPIDSVEALIAAAHRLVCEHNIDRGRVIGVGVGIAMQPEALAVKTGWYHHAILAGMECLCISCSVNDYPIQSLSKPGLPLC